MIAFLDLEIEIYLGFGNWIWSLQLKLFLRDLGRKKPEQPAFVR